MDKQQIEEMREDAERLQAPSALTYAFIALIIVWAIVMGFCLY